MRNALLAAFIAFAPVVAAPLPSLGSEATERKAMVEDIKRLSQTLADGTGRYALEPRVLAVMEQVPRHEFVPEAQRHAAYRNRPLPIGQGQTISQPYIVALMTGLLQLKPEHRVLEVGTGSGYQAAVLARLAREVFTIEIIAELGRTAAETLARLDYGNVKVRVGDGYLGWPEEAPFDAIIVTAAPDHVPQALVAQLKPGGRLVIPVGSAEQDLLVVEKKPDGTATTEEIVPVRFVPLTRQVR